MPYHIASFIGIVLQTSANDDDNDARTEIKLKIVGKWTVSRVKTHRAKARVVKKELPLLESEECSMKNDGSVGEKSLAIF